MEDKRNIIKNKTMPCTEERICILLRREFICCVVMDWMTKFCLGFCAHEIASISEL